MSIANGTTHYGYPQVQLTDRPTFADFNPAFQDIDAKLYGLITGATTDHAAIEALQTGLGETNLALAGVKDTADAAKAKADANEENIGILQTSLGNTDRTVATKLDSVAIAEPYDASAGTYAVGDVVVYNGQRYRCTTAVAVSEPFDADKWTGEDVETVLERMTRKIVVTNTANETFSSLLDRLYSQLTDVSVLDLAKAILVRTNTTLDYKWGVAYHFRMISDTTIIFSALSGETGDGSIAAELVHLKASASRYMVVNRKGESGVVPTVDAQEKGNQIAGISAGEDVWTLEW